MASLKEPGVVNLTLTMKDRGNRFLQKVSNSPIACLFVACGRFTVSCIFFQGQIQEAVNAYTEAMRYCVGHGEDSAVCLSNRALVISTFDLIIFMIYLRVLLAGSPQGRNAR